jgi:predicted RNase H-like HicB family nuclease
MKIQVMLEPSSDGGFTAVVPALPGCFTEGETRAEALRNVEEAIRLYLESVADELVRPVGAEVVEITV